MYGSKRNNRKLKIMVNTRADFNTLGIVETCFTINGNNFTIENIHKRVMNYTLRFAVIILVISK